MIHLTQLHRAAPVGPRVTVNRYGWAGETGGVRGFTLWLVRWSVCVDWG